METLYKVSNPQNQGANISIIFRGRLVELMSGTEDVLSEEQALFLKERYPWVKIESLGELPEEEGDSNTGGTISVGVEVPNMKWRRPRLVKYAKKMGIKVNDKDTKEYILGLIEDKESEVVE